MNSSEKQSSKSETKKLNRIIFLIGIVIVNFVINLVVYWWGSKNPEQSSKIYIYYENVNLLVWSILATFSFFALLRSFKINTTAGKVWLFLGTGLLCWLIGDIYWAYYELILYEISPFPSIADYFYTLGYLFLFIGVYLQLKLANIKLSKIEIIIVIVFEVILMIFSLIYLIIPILQYPISEEFTIVQLFYSLLYPIADLILAPFTIQLILKYKGGRFSRVWLLISLGFITSIFADLIFSYLEWNGYQVYWNFIDHLFIGYSMIFTIGAQYLKQILQ